MVKRICVALCAILMALLPVWAAAENRVFDDAELFSASEIRALEDKIETIREAYQVDAVVLTSYDAPYGRSLDYADLFYERGNFGMGEDDAGLLFFIDMNNRVPTISTTGMMIDYITDSRLEVLLDCGYNELAYGAYGDAAMRVLEKLDDYMRQGRQEGSFRYDAQTGRRLSGLYNTLTAAEVGIAAIIAAAAALIFVSVVSARYSLKGGTYRYDIGEHASRSLTKDQETFLRQHVSRTTHHHPTGGAGGHGGSSGRGSAVHRSSSGGFHGGGSGRKF